jgi:predicted kinase
MQTKVLLMMLGHPGSGKSYFAKHLSSEMLAVRLNADHARRIMFPYPEHTSSRDNNPVVFGALNYAAGEILRAGHNVIYDIQHNSRHKRDEGKRIAQEFGARAIIVWIKTPYQVALQRGIEREDTEDQRKKSLAQMEASIKYFMDALEPLSPDEDCIVIDGTEPFIRQSRDFHLQLAKLIG